MKFTKERHVSNVKKFYEALGSIENRSEIDMNLLVKLLEVTRIVPYQEMMKEKRKILSPERAQQLRDKVFK